MRIRAQALVAPRDEMDARVRVEQMRAIAQNNSHGAAIALIAVLLAGIDLQWAPWLGILPWLVLVLALQAWMTHGCRKVLAEEQAPSQAAALTLRMIAICTPFMAVWPTMVLFVWQSGNPLNNGYLITFLFVSMASCVPLTGLSRYIAVPALAIDIPILATHPFAGLGGFHWLAPVVQALAGLLIFSLSLSYERTYRGHALQRIEKEALAIAFEKAAAELAQARDTAQKASRSKSEFLANMSHELRTPLNAIIGFADIIRSQMLGAIAPTKYADYAEDIHRSGVHLLGLINNLLDLAKIEAGKQDLVDRDVEIDEVAGNVLRFVEMQARKAEVSIVSEIDPALGLYADERAVTQVLTNLASNAVKFTQPGGCITIFSHAVDGGGLALGVKDTGIGMEPEEVQRALEPFVQVAHVTTVEGWGTGLGVPLVKALVELHGGTFHIESHRGIGTCAWGEFPASRTWQIRPEAGVRPLRAAIGV